MRQRGGKGEIFTLLEMAPEEVRKAKPRIFNAGSCNVLKYNGN